MNKGIWYGIGAYLAWGIFPIYWKWLHVVPAVQLISHRIIWSFVLVAIILFVTRQWKAFRAAITGRRVLLIYLASAILLSINWLTYVWAVNAGYVIETSLGYFINPLLSVLLGVIFLHEHLRPWQWATLGLATVGVVYAAVAYGQFPWIALTLAFSFGLYGLVKKTAPLGSLYGLTLETGILFVPAVAFLVLEEFAGKGAFLHTGSVDDLLMIGAGVVTTVPLLMFASAAQRIPLSTVGVLQYITPTMQFLLGLLLYREPFTRAHLVGFSIVWLALLIFWLEGYLATSRRRRLEAAAAGK
ncbi:MAG TPA: EamA family transporter RarD [Anaerolineales bacterium]|nr:EamA family transporter RarD [Anaerolineales bacterium]